MWKKTHTYAKKNKERNLMKYVKGKIELWKVDRTRRKKGNTSHHFLKYVKTFYLGYTETLTETIISDKIACRNIAHKTQKKNTGPSLV